MCIDINNFISGLVEKRTELINKLIVDGLEKKGFVFNEEKKLHDFIKNNCDVVSSDIHGGHFYKVNKENFLFIESIKIGDQNLNSVSYRFL